MFVKNLAIVACLASAAMAQAVGSIFCQARYITNVATCVIGVKECNVVERFSSCVCANTGYPPALRLCLIALISDPSFKGILLDSDYKILMDDVEKLSEANEAAEKPSKSDEKPSKSDEKPSEKPAEPTEKPAEPTEKPAEPTEKPAEPTETPAAAAVAAEVKVDL